MRFIKNSGKGIKKIMKPFEEKDFLALSALQHILFCKRQCALIHIEQLWVENRFTAEGRIMHERVDRGDQTDRGKVRIEYSLPLKSSMLGISGKADVVEFHGQAQAFCLEEMLDVRIKSGALFYGKTRRRLDVAFDDDLRNQTINAAVQLHEMVSSGITPPPEYTKKCDACSFISLCLPKTLEKKRTVSSWIKRMIQKD